VLKVRCHGSDGWRRVPRDLRAMAEAAVYEEPEFVGLVYSAVWGIALASRHTMYIE